MKTYKKMRKQEAAAALQEFLDERPRALENLNQNLGQHSDHAVSLDGTVDSLIPLWRWVKSVLTERTTETLDTDVSAKPIWIRYGIGTEPTLAPESVALIDGVISYLCRVVEQGAPKARWRVGYNRIKSYVWQNHPVLAHDNEEEPLIEVEDLGEDEIRGRELEVSLREDIAHEYSREVDRLVKALAKEEGISGAVREDREVLLVNTPSWTTDQLQQWITRYIEDNFQRSKRR